MDYKGLIYIADDEKDIRDLIKRFLQEAGHEVVAFENGDDLYASFEDKEPDLIILDVMMPGTDGFSLSVKIRKRSDVPIVFLTARDTDADYMTGFTAGGDDYFTKPFSPVKLTMRVNAILKREKNRVAAKTALEFGDIRIDASLKNCFVKGAALKLTKTEYDLMQYLLERQDQAVSREELLDKIWGYDALVETRVTDDTIKRLRKKLRTAESGVEIETVWGFGFRLKLISE